MPERLYMLSVSNTRSVIKSDVMLVSHTVSVDQMCERLCYMFLEGVWISTGMNNANF